MTLQEALDYSKNLNKSISLKETCQDKELLVYLAEIEDYLFPHNENKTLIDLNPDIYKKSLNPKF
jgi:hypothetical protein